MSTWILCQWSEEGQIDYAGYSAHSHHTARSKCFHCIKPPSWSHISVIVQSRRCSTPCLVTTLQWRGCDLARSGDPRSGAGSGVPHPAHAAARACTCPHWWSRHTGTGVGVGERGPLGMAMMVLCDEKRSQLRGKYSKVARMILRKARKLSM